MALKSINSDRAKLKEWADKAGADGKAMLDAFRK
jgi:hypothetical protein